MEFDNFIIGQREQMRGELAKKKQQLLAKKIKPLLPNIEYRKGEE